MDNISPLELERILSDRIELVKRDKTFVREQIEDYDTKIKNLRKLQEKSNLPKEKDEELAQLLYKLEHQHATTPQNNFDEREFMKEKERIRQKRKIISSYTKTQGEIDLLRVKLNEFRKQQTELDDSLNELSTGLRRIKVANRAGCHTHEIIEKRFIIEFQRVGSIVGRGGANLRAIEFEYKVSIEFDNHDCAVRIMGTERAIDGAFAAILTIVETCVEEFHLTDESIVCLLMDKAHLVNEMQSKYNIRMDLSRAKNMCKITGLTDNVFAAKSEIQSLQSVRSDILIDSAVLPVVFGKGGANIVAWQDEFGVSININRERNTIEIVGLKLSVSNAIIRIKDLVDSNKEVEEIIKMEKHVLLGCLIGAGGQVVRGVSKDYGVRIDTEGNREEKFQSIRIKGTFVKVAAAKDHILNLVNEFISSTLMFEVHEDVIPAILGKGGSDIKALRDRYKEANIDLDGNMIHIQSSSPKLRELIKNELDNIIQANYIQMITLGEDCILQYKYSKSQAIREKLLKELNLKVLIEKDNVSIKLRGTKKDVEQGIRILEEFRLSNTAVKVILQDEDFAILAKTADENILQTFETKYGIEIIANRKELCLTLRGPQKQLVAGKEAVEGFFSGDIKYGALLIELPNIVFSAMIGKNGSNISKMEEELQVKFDAVRSTFKLRIRSNVPEKILAAKSAVNAFIQNTRVTDNIELTTTLSVAEIDAVIKECCDIFNVEVLIATKNQQIKILTIKGVYMLLMESIRYLREELSDQPYIFTIPVYPPHTAKIQSHVLKNLQNKYANSITFELKETSSKNIKEVKLQMKGHVKFIKQEKLEILKLFENYFSSEMLIIETPPTYLRDAFDGKIYTDIKSLDASCVMIDHVLGFIVAFGTESDILNIKRSLSRHLQDWKACNVFIPVDKSLMPLIVGKNGVSINALRKEIKVSLDVSPIGSGLEIKGNDKMHVEEARILIERRVRQLQSEQYEIDAPVDFLPILIGKQGVTINKLRNDTETSIDLDGGKIRIRGKPEKVIASKNIILDMINNYHMQSSGFKSMTIPTNGIPVLYGPKGNTIREIQLNHSVKLEMDRDTGKLTIRGSVDGVEKAANVIEQILSNAGLSLDQEQSHELLSVSDGNQLTENSQETFLPDTTNQEQYIDTKNKPKLLPGAPPAVLQKLSEMSLSKSALKRLRKKQSLASTGTTSFENTAVSEEEPIADQPIETRGNTTNEVEKNPVSNQLAVSTATQDLNLAAPSIASLAITANTIVNTDNSSIPPSSFPPALGVIGRASSSSGVERDITLQSVIPTDATSLLPSTLQNNQPANIYEMLSSYPPPSLQSQQLHQQQFAQTNTGINLSSLNNFGDHGNNNLSTDNLLNLLLGKSFDPVPTVGNNSYQLGVNHQQHNLNGFDTLSLNQPHSNNVSSGPPPSYFSNPNILQNNRYNDFHGISSNSMGLMPNSYPTSNLVPPPPPGIAASVQHRPLGELHIQTGASIHQGSSHLLSAPPPGLSPTYFTPTAGPPHLTGLTGRDSSSSNFSFLDYGPSNPNLHGTQNYLSNDLSSILSGNNSGSLAYQHSTSTLPSNSNNTMFHPSMVPSNNSSSIDNSNQASQDYYKSKNGLSVRL